MKSCAIPSSHSSYALQIPDSVRVTVAVPPHFPDLPEPRQLIREALDHPIGTPPIEEMVRPNSKICIICDDITRPTPVWLILEHLLPRLLAAGVPKENIFFVIALGSHRRMTREEMIKKLGKRVVEEYTVLNSEFSDPSMLTQVGTSQLGTPIRVFKPAMEADFRIAIGNIIPHGCMGWSGGAKILYPGITSEDIVSEFHVMQGFQDGIVYGMDECPVRLAVEEWTQKIGLHFIINMALTGDFRIYRVVAGDYIQAHRAGVENSKKTLGIPVPRKPNIVVVSSYPTDQDMWQCTKGVYAGGRIIAQGGSMIVLAPCVEGVGPHKDFPSHLGLYHGLEKLKARIDARETGEELLSMAVGVSIGKLHDICTIHWLTNGCTEEEIRPSRFVWHREEEIQTVFDQVLAQYQEPEVLIIPVGGESFPYLADEKCNMGG